MATRDALFSTALFGVMFAAVLRLGDDAGFLALPRVIVLAMFGVVPLALLTLRDVGPRTERLVRVAAFVGPFPAALASYAFMLDAPAGAWIVGWFSMTLMLAALGVSHFFEGPRFEPSRWPAVAGFLMVPIGAAWLFASRQDMTVLGFHGTMVLLTAVHFHFGALGATALTARVAGMLEGRERSVAAACAVAIVMGFPIVAAGFLVSAWLGLIGAFMLALGLLGIAVLMLRSVRPRLKRRSARGLLTISGLSVFLSMPLAALYQIGQVSGLSLIDIEWMVRLHGYANAHGVVMCGLFAFALEDRGGAIE